MTDGRPQDSGSERPPGRPRFLAPAIGGLAAVLLVTGVLVVAQDDDDVELGLTGDTATTTADEDATSATGAGADPDAPAGGGAAESGGSVPLSEPPEADAGSSAPAAANDEQSSAKQGAAPDPGPTAPPRAGVYRYRSITERDGQREESETPTEISDEEHSGDGTIQVIKGKIGETDATSRVHWTASQVLLLETTFHMNGRDARCDWEPDHVELQLPLRMDLEWTASSSCTMTGLGPSPITVERETTSRVTAVERREIAGQVLDLWVIESDDHIEFSTVVIDATTKTWFAPSHGLRVRIEGSGSGGSGAGSGRSGSYEREILNLEPE